MKRKLPQKTQIYAYCSQDYRGNPKCGDLYEFEKFKILVTEVLESENLIIYYRNGIRKVINSWEFRPMIITTPGKYTFSCYPN